MAGFDPVLQSPVRLTLATLLTGVSEIEFVTLRDDLAVSDSVLSKHISTLAAEGYVRSRKAALDGRRTTWISITNQGRAALSAHVKALREIIAGIE
ncbi:MAG: transcriptional regulator [Microbacterium sp.]|nr:transcriptional regulator [Microbacterium sp.]